MKSWNVLFSYLGCLLLSINLVHAEENRDPFEGVNRSIFAFNDKADQYVLKPLASGYRKITPDPVEEGVSNVFANLFEVTTIANGLLQGKFKQAGSDTGRFLINSTVGLFGIFDVATHLGLEKHDEDFGQTLGYWGVPSGPYIVVPLFGPYTIRSGVGDLIQTETTGYVKQFDHPRSRNQVYALDQIQARAKLLDAEELISGDRYIFIRDAYLQSRDSLVNDGVVEDTFGDESFDDDWE